MTDLNAAAYFKGRVLIAVPHMDDAVLACGGTLLRIPDRRNIRLVYCTDGRGILHYPRPLKNPSHGEERIGEVRQAETKAALGRLGIDADQLVFLDFPERSLPRNRRALREQLEQQIRAFRPACVLAPFRYDKHPDHVALSQAVRTMASSAEFDFHVLQYFVYYTWRLLPGGDIRKYIAPDHLLGSDISAVAQVKRQALDCFASQTTCFYPWQHKPVLSDGLLDTFARGPELFLTAAPDYADRDVITLPSVLVRALHAVEPAMKVAKELLLIAWHRLLRRRHERG